MKKVKLFSMVAAMSLVVSMGVSQLGEARAYASYENEGYGCIQKSEKYGQDGLEYELQEDGSYMVTGCNSTAESVTVPSEVNGRNISRIKSFGYFAGKEVIISDSVKDIDDNAFIEVCCLDKVVLPEGLQVIKKGTFTGCCRLRTVELPSSLKSIEDEAFRACYLLESIKIPASVESISKSAFMYCYLLSDISVDEGNKFFNVAEDGSLLNVVEDTIVVRVDREDLARKEKIADALYEELKSFVSPGMTLKDLEKKIDTFMQERGGGKPEVLSNKAFETEVINNQKTVLYRGVVGRKYFKLMKTGDKTYFPYGFNGNGIYTTCERSYAKMYTSNNNDSFIMRMFLKDDAKVISIVDIDTIRHIVISKHYDEFPESEIFVFGFNPDNVNRRLITNRGFMATILGFDALDCSDNSDEFSIIGNETVILNRSKLAICEDAELL